MPEPSIHPSLPRLTIVSPCFNEREVIGQFIEAVLAVADELRAQCDVRVLLVDDGSKDGSRENLEAWSQREPRVSWLGLSRNFGHQAALSAGLDHAPAGAVLLMDSDLEHPPATIPELVRHWLAGSEIVSAVRQDPQGLPWWKHFTSGLFYRVFNSLSETKLRAGAADFVLLSARARAALVALPEYHRFLRAMVAWIGFARTFVPYVQPVRPAGRSKYTARRMLRLALSGVLSFSTRPIYVVFAISLVLCGLGTTYLAYALWMRLVAHETMVGWTSLVAVVLSLGGWQTMVCSLLGLYVAKVFEQVKGRPPYVIGKPLGESTNEQR